MPDSGRSPGAPVTDFLHTWSGGEPEELDMDVVEMGTEGVLRIDHALTWKFARARLQRELTR